MRLMGWTITFCTFPPPRPPIVALAALRFGFGPKRSLDNLRCRFAELSGRNGMGRAEGAVSLTGKEAEGTQTLLRKDVRSFDHLIFRTRRLEVMKSLY